MSIILALAIFFQASGQDDLEKLKKKVTDLETEVEKLMEEKLDQAETAPAKTESANAFNPSITAFLNAAMRIDNHTVEAAGHDHGGGGSDSDLIDDRFWFRGAELDFRGSVDAYVDAVLLLGIHQESNGEFGIHPEEAYGILKQIPILEAAPLGMKLKVGRYRAPLGTMNLLHQHDWAWTTAPLAVSTYLGSEGGTFFESGFAMEGLGLMMQLPSFEGTSLDFELHAARAGKIAVTEEAANPSNPAGVGKLNFFTELGEGNDLSIGLSGYLEELGNRVIVADFLYRWRPTGEFQSLVFGGEWHFVNRHIAGEEKTSPNGGFLYLQYQLNWNVYLGVRWDHVQGLEEVEEETDVYSAYVSYYTTEFFRMRLGYEHRASDHEEEDGLNSLFVEFNFVFGSHPAEPWWVNR
jgi:hypothetical protein